MNESALLCSLWLALVLNCSGFTRQFYHKGSVSGDDVLEFRLEDLYKNIEQLYLHAKHSYGHRDKHNAALRPGRATSGVGGRWC